LMLVTELMPRGSVEELIHEQKVSLTFKQRLKIAKDCVLGMNWLHRLNPPFLHLDLKLGNLLVDQNWTVKVADFGLSKIVDEEDEDMELVGSPFYMAPEMLLQKEITEKVDIYSFGIVLWELYTQERPYNGLFENLEELIDAVTIDGERPEIPPQTPEALKQLITSCWDTDPAARPSFHEILRKNLLDHIIIDSIIAEPTGQALWKQEFVDDDVLEWTEFLKGFVRFFKVKKSQLSPNSPSLMALRLLIADQTGTSVTLESFGRCADCFGPIGNGLEFLSNIDRVAKNAYFHGDLSRAEAETRLRGQESGTFLLRMSASTAGSFILSIVQDQGRFAHVRVLKTNGSYQFDGRSFDSLDALVDAYTSSLGLKACPNSPYYKLYHGDNPAPPTSPNLPTGYTNFKAFAGEKTMS